jgi:hypothetical protein
VRHFVCESRGILIGEVRKHIQTDDSVQDIWKHALKARNKLFHGFYERHNHKIETDIGRAEMIADLAALQQHLAAGWQSAGALSGIMVEFIHRQQKSNSH